MVSIYVRGGARMSEAEVSGRHFMNMSNAFCGVKNVVSSRCAYNVDLTTESRRIPEMMDFPPFCVGCGAKFEQIEQSQEYNMWVRFYRHGGDEAKAVELITR